MRDIINTLALSVFSPLAEPVVEMAEFILERSPKLKGHIGIVLLTDLGEKVCFLPVLMSLKKQCPKAVIHLFVDEHGFEIFANNPYVDYLHLVPVQRWRRLSADSIHKTLQNWIYKNKEHLRYVFNFSPSIFSAGLATVLASSFNRAFGFILDEDQTPVFKGNKWMQFFYYVVYPTLCFHEVCNLSALSKKSMYELALGLPIGKHTDTSFPLKRPIFTDTSNIAEDLDKDRLYVGICPGAYFATRQWPIPKFEQLVKGIHDEFGVDILIIDEQKRDYSSLSRYPFIKDVSGRPLKDLMAYLSNCRSVVSNHNALIQVTGALSIPSLIICGGHTKGPEFDGVHVAIRRVVPCSPCYVASCHRMYCMEELSAQDVMDIFRYQWDLIKTGHNPLPYEIPAALTKGGQIEILCRCPHLPESVYKYVTAGKELSLCVSHKVIDISYTLLWDRANQILCNMPPLLDREQMLDWIYTFDMDWDFFSSFLAKEIEFIREWEDRLSILLLRLKEFFSNKWMFWRQELDIDMENLLDSLASFDATFPQLFTVIAKEEENTENDTGESVLERIRAWIEKRKFLLQLLVEYRSMLEDFLFHGKEIVMASISKNARGESCARGKTNEHS